MQLCNFNSVGDDMMWLLLEIESSLMCKNKEWRKCQIWSSFGVCMGCIKGESVLMMWLNLLQAFEFAICYFFKWFLEAPLCAFISQMVPIQGAKSVGT